MKEVEFTEEYHTQIETIDYEHAKLFQYMNNIINAEQLGEGSRLIIEINLDELISYTVYHFKTEEELMQKLNDPNYESHKKAHDALKERVLEFKKRFDAQENITEELVSFLENWLIKHIKGVDMQYVELFKENNVK